MNEDHNGFPILAFQLGLGTLISSLSSTPSLQLILTYPNLLQLLVFIKISQLRSQKAWLDGKTLTLD